MRKQPSIHRDPNKEVENAITILQSMIAYRTNPIGPPPIEPQCLEKTIELINEMLAWDTKHNKNKQPLLTFKIRHALYLIATKFDLNKISQLGIIALLENLIYFPGEDSQESFNNLKLLLTKVTVVPPTLFELADQAIVTAKDREAQEKHIYLKHWICDFKLKQLIKLQHNTNIDFYATQLQAFAPYLQDMCFIDVLKKFSLKNKSQVWLNVKHLLIFTVDDKYQNATNIIHTLLTLTGTKNHYENMFMFLYNKSNQIADIGLHEQLANLITKLLPSHRQTCLNTIIITSPAIRTATAAQIKVLYDFYKVTMASNANIYLVLLYTYKQGSISQCDCKYLLGFMHLYESYQLKKVDPTLSNLIVNALEIKLASKSTNALRPLLNSAINKHYPKKLLSLITKHYLLQCQEEHLTPSKSKNADQFKERDTDSTINADSEDTSPKSNILKRKQPQEDSPEYQIKRRHHTRAATAQLADWEEYNIEQLFLTLAAHKTSVRITHDDHKNRKIFTTDYTSVLQKYTDAKHHLYISHSLLMTLNGYNNLDDPLIFGLYFVNQTDSEIIIENLLLPFWGKLRFVQASDRDISIAPHIKTLSNPLNADARCIEHARDMTAQSYWNPPGAYHVNHNNRTDNNVMMVNIVTSDIVEDIPVQKFPAIFIQRLVIPSHKAQEITVNYPERAEGANRLPREIKSKYFTDEQLQCPATDITAINEKNYQQPRPSNTGLFGVKRPQLWINTDLLKPQTAHK